jgi:glutamate-1-semialdehyde aminotransferase
MARRLLRGLNALFVEKGVNWVAYGEFSGVSIVPEYDGPAATGDDFIPYQNSLEKLDRKFDPTLSHAFRCAMLLGGVDMFGGWRAMLSGAHSPEDIDRTVAACGEAIDLLRADGLLA